MKLKGIKSLTIYCASSSKIDKKYINLGNKIGEIIAKNNINLTYGGGNNGLMGVISNSVKLNGGYVTGIIPRFLVSTENLNTKIDKIIKVKNMSERKKLLLEKGDAILTLPGGPGTLEEIAEIISWLNLGIHSKPIIIFNYNSFWNKLILLYKQMYKQKFINTKYNNLFYLIDNISQFKKLF